MKRLLIPNFNQENNKDQKRKQWNEKVRNEDEKWIEDGRCNHIEMFNI